MLTINSQICMTYTSNNSCQALWIAGHSQCHKRRDGEVTAKLEDLQAGQHELSTRSVFIRSTLSTEMLDHLEQPISGHPSIFTLMKVDGQV